MTITIKFFALGRELVGAQSLTLELPESGDGGAGTAATVEDVLERVRAEKPRFAELPSFLVALNAQYAERTAAVRDGDELAIIPPVSGG